MNLENAWYGNRQIIQSETPAANATILVGDALLDNICQRLEKELPAVAYMDQDALALLIGVAPKTLANRRAMYPERYPAPIYFGGNKKPLFPRSDILNWLAREEYQAKSIHWHRCV
ncbi:hypothetical protein CTTA_4703 [Comamonas testosteroni]|uniref:DNA-binding protein n=1 Tax=Comamonas testosteroni TaxID=285 RepID=A0A5A7MIN3_COMTE|nr:hypothetical protein [Comamonas testosteroni]GEQ77698.1 hypothetical protein CTTA_4703 [Comamonas testosteroni]